VNRLLLTIAVGALCATGLAAQKSDPPQGQATEQSDQARLKAESDARWQRLQVQHQATEAARRAEQARYEQSLRDAAAARARYEQDVRNAEAARVRYEADVARSNRRRAEYDRRMAERAEREGRRTRSSDRDARATEAAPVRTASSDRTCEQQRDRSRRRGRGIGSVVGGIAGSVIGGPAGGVANVVTSVLPVGALLGEAIASLLDCDEQQKAANATEEAVRGGVGTTSTWTSETRPGVTGSSTVTAADPAASSDPCLTVTDIVIIEGEETRVPKRMCRRPPANRYVRV
jgi:surface antigen